MSVQMDNASIPQGYTVHLRNNRTAVLAVGREIEIDAQ